MAHFIKSDVGFENYVGAIDGLLICSEKLTEKFVHDENDENR
jgi:hypothetical protein